MRCAARSVDVLRSRTASAAAAAIVATVITAVEPRLLLPL